MTNPTLLFWSKQKRVIEWCGATDQAAIPTDFQKLNCIDLNFPPDRPIGRYGNYLPNYGWYHIPKEKFDPEFLLVLLLMGVH